MTGGNGGQEERPTVAVFRPGDERLDEARSVLADLGAEPLADPMLAVDPTGAVPRSDAAFALFTSKTGAELVADAGWTAPPGTIVCAIGETTAEALAKAGYRVDEVPEEFSSTGLVEHLGDRVDGARVEVARSDHGSDVLLDGLQDAGAFVHETVLYRLVRPEGAGDAVTAAAAGGLDAALFTSSLTVEHFLAVAAERDRLEAVLDGLADATVGAIGDPTKETAEAAGITVDVVPDEADFERLATATLDGVEDSSHEGI
jgi:uroporphyrinogen-III synthase